MKQNEIEKKLGFLNETVSYYLKKYFDYHKGKEKIWDDFKNDGHLKKLFEIISVNIANIETIVDLKNFIKNKFKRYYVSNENDLVKADIDDILLENIKVLKERLDNKIIEVKSLHSEMSELEKDFDNFKKSILILKPDELENFQKKLKNNIINDLTSNAVEIYNKDVEQDDDPSIDVNMFKNTNEYKKLVKEIRKIDENISLEKIGDKINYFGSARYKYENNSIKCNIEGAKSLCWMKVTSFIKNRKRYNKIRGVYIFWNRTKNLFYVGQSKNLRDRIGGYFNYKTLECINKKFGDDYNSNDEFYLSIYKLPTSEKCDFIEKKYIKIFNSFKGPGYNQTSGNI